MGRPRKAVSLARAADETGVLPDSMWRELVELGLVPYEARVLLALLVCGATKAPDVAQISGVIRTSVYPTLERLAEKGLAERLPGEGVAVWATPGREQVLERLLAAQVERLQQQKARTERLREKLAELVPPVSSTPVPYVHVIRRAAQVKKIYDEMLAGAEHELVMFTRPPYTSGAVNPMVLETLARGVRARVLYQAGFVEDPAAQNWLAAYHDAGVESRLVEDLPIKLVVVDRRAVLVAMADPVLGDDGYPTTMHIEHPGYAGVHANSFEQTWATARLYTPARAVTADDVVGLGVETADAS